MDSLKIYGPGDLFAFVRPRPGEKKLGEVLQTVSSLEALESASARYVLLGIPEDIGVRANYGIGGAKTAWEATLNAFLNLQCNPFLTGSEILVLGHFEIEEPADQTVSGLRKKTAALDNLIYPVIESIVRLGKIPIVIGGGHNNAFPIIGGFYLGSGREKVNVVNIDAHADLRNPLEGRHSGNGFSMAFGSGFLDEYRIFGLHENYVHEDLPDYFARHPEIKVKYFEELLRSEGSVVDHWKEFVGSLTAPCGLEIDLDSIDGFMSSAISPTGFSLNEVRRILLNNEQDFGYLHLCEGAVQLSDGRNDATTGKGIAYLISDFIKALRPRISEQPSS